MIIWLQIISLTLKLKSTEAGSCLRNKTYFTFGILSLRVRSSRENVIFTNSVRQTEPTPTLDGGNEGELEKAFGD